MDDIVIERIQESINVKKGILTDKVLLNTIRTLADRIVECIRDGGKIVLCGNGGSATDALHFAGEIVGRFQRERLAWPALVLNADIATMTAIANDYGYDDVFARQAEAHVSAKDIFIGISTSGDSKNVLHAINVVKEKGTQTAALLGRDGGEIGKVVDYPIIVSCNITARVQESHIMLIHIICEIVENKLSCEEQVR